MSETLLTCPTCQIPNFTYRGLKAHKCKGGTRMNHTTGLVEVIPPSKSPLVQKAEALRQAHADAPGEEVEVVTASQVDAAELDGLASEIVSKIDLIAGHEGAFEEATLEHRLEIGLHIAKAQEIFTMSNSDRASLGGDAKAALSTVDRAQAPPAISQGFITWLGKNVPALKRPTAYRYAAAFRSLGIPAAEASPAKIRAKLKDLRHFAGKSNLPMPTLAALVKAAPKPPKPTTLNIEEPKDTKQLRLEDAREAFHVWQATFEKLVKQGSLDDLDKKGVENLKEFLAGARDRINARLK
jgi:hypothetical protein